MGEQPARQEVRQFANIKKQNEHVRRPLRRINMMQWEPSIDDVLARLSSPAAGNPANTGTDHGGAGSNK